MGFDKIAAPLGGRPLIAHSLSAFNDCPDVDHIVLVCATDRLDEFQTFVSEFPKLRRVVLWSGTRRIRPAGMAPWRIRGRFVAVHDGARPLITPEAVSSCYQAAREFGASASAEPVTDTLHRVNNQSLTVETVSSKVWRMQTCRS
jgi:2-C-methyl-D-erythritol 4-phosphate cytidylyltransferase